MRWWKKALIGAGIAITPFALLAAAFVWRFIPFPPDPDYPPPAERVEAMRQDLDFLRRFPDYDWTFTDEETVAFQSVITGIEAELDSITDARFELAVARAVALADNAHTNVSPIARRARVNALPVRFAWFADELRVVLSDDANSDLLGAAVESIGGRTPKEIAQIFQPTFGGHAGRARWISTLNMESPALLHAAEITPTPDRVEILFETSDGAVTARILEAMEPFTDRAMRRYGGDLLEYVVPAPVAGEWHHLMEGETPPLYLSQPATPFFAEWVDTDAGAGLYLHLEMTMDIDGFDLSDFHERVLTSLEERAARFVVVDLRHNGGGTVDAGFSKGVTGRLGEDGRIFVLTSPQTFSGGITEAAYFKHFGGDRAMVLGEPVGDRLVFWANGGSPMTLPNSQIPVRVWVAKEDWESGCDDWWLCLWPTMLTDVGVGSLEPDILTPLTFADYRAGRDPVIERVIAIIEGDD